MKFSSPGTKVCFTVAVALCLNPIITYQNKQEV